MKLLHFLKDLTSIKKTTVTLLSIVLLLGASATQVHGVNAINQLVPFQGRLHNSEGNVVKDGVYDLTFFLYETPTGGEALWSENHTQVSVIHGYVNVLLGAMEGSKFSQNGVSFATQKFLSISINGGQEMFPRHQLVPTFHAYNSDKLGGIDAIDYATDSEVNAEVNTLNTRINNELQSVNLSFTNKFVEGSHTAKNADALDGHDSSYFLPSSHTKDLVPVGTILAWASATPPEGYVECDGRYLSKTTYAELFSVLGTTYGSTASDFKVPNYRGLFLRGWANGDSTYEPDSSRAVGSIQTESFKAHTHDYTRHWYRYPGDGLYHNAAANESHKRQTTVTQTSKSTGGDETRPDNIAVMYIIKAKSHTP